MTATQFLNEFLANITTLYMDGVINSVQYHGLHEFVVPELESVLRTAVADETDYYESEYDAEHDFHALDDARFERIEREYEGVWTSQ